MIECDHTVKRLLALAPSPFGHFYLIETTLHFPCFVVGEVRADKAVRHLLKCGLESNARQFWNKLVADGEPAADSAFHRSSQSEVIIL